MLRVTCLLMLCNVQSEKEKLQLSRFSVCGKGQCVSRFLLWQVLLLCSHVVFILVLEKKFFLFFPLVKKMPVMIIKNKITNNKPIYSDI